MVSEAADHLPNDRCYFQVSDYPDAGWATAAIPDVLTSLTNSIESMKDGFAVYFDAANSAFFVDVEYGNGARWIETTISGLGLQDLRMALSAGPPPLPIVVQEWMQTKKHS
jgi:hypothetical protein